jgi:protein-L-isoaspartate(D-aspartate) O-methyltransferase
MRGTGLRLALAALIVTAVAGRPAPPGAAERVQERRRMVEAQIERRDVTDQRVLEAMRTVPRHVFVPEASRREAYGDYALSIGHGQTISQPYIVALMSELIDLEAGQRVLEVGTGSGYQAAVLAHLTEQVYTIEIVEPLYEQSGRALAAQGYDAVHRKQGDGYYGWPEHGPYDAIIVTCAAGHVPPPLWKQLKPGGRMVIPIGGPYETQRLVVATKDRDGKRTTKSVLAVRFVPMTGAAQR